MSTNNVIYSQDSISYHKKILITSFDGSEANRHAKKEAANYLRGWIKHMFDFAELADTDACKYCRQEANGLQNLIKLASNRDGIKW